MSDMTSTLVVFGIFVISLVVSIYNFISDMKFRKKRIEEIKKRIKESEEN